MDRGCYGALTFSNIVIVVSLGLRTPTLLYQDSFPSVASSLTFL